MAQKWNLQKGLILMLSIAAMGGAALRTALTFERRKRNFFDQEYERVRQERFARERKKREAFRAKRKLQVEAEKEKAAMAKPAKPWQTASRGAAQTKAARGKQPAGKPAPAGRR